MKRVSIKRIIAQVSEIYCDFKLRDDVIAPAQFGNYLDKRLGRMPNETSHRMGTYIAVSMAAAKALL